MAEDVFITAAARTAMGGFQGALSPLSAPEIGGAAIAAALAQQRADKELIDDVIMGCVLPAGLGQAPARQASFAGGLSESVPCTTVNKMCGSGLKAVMLGYDQIKSSGADMIIAGGMESMSNAPYLAAKVRGGARLGHQGLSDHMFLDGLEDAYDKGKLMGSFAEDCAEYYQFSREAQDDYALRSLRRAQNAQQDGKLTAEICPVTVTTRKGSHLVDSDEQPQLASPEKIPHLKPAFREGGTVTAANSSSISDGAAALGLASGQAVKTHGLAVRARICAHAGFAHAPGWFTTAPVHAARKLVNKLGWQTTDVDIWEVNEAFAVVAMAFIRELELDPEHVNIHGGACALGHPIGASGARILVSLLNALDQTGGTKGIAAICLGGGEGIAVAVEMS
ncbi:MAG TPA: acetyl-CoA C-acetyltransferase [Alphaproteobacteria bacterium]|nr:acetyl-CoA C-acetyltransferase [Alphaproteobacteria bacterium]